MLEKESHEKIYKIVRKYVISTINKIKNVEIKRDLFQIKDKHNCRICKYIQYIANVIQREEIDYQLVVFQKVEIDLQKM